RHRQRAAAAGRRDARGPSSPRARGAWRPADRERDRADLDHGCLGPGSRRSRHGPRAERSHSRGGRHDAPSPGAGLMADIVFDDGGTLVPVVIDATPEERHRMSAIATDQEVERGVTTTDHVRPEPRLLTLQAVISDTPLGP